MPNFADAAGVAELAGWDLAEPLPLEIVSAEEAAQAFFPDGEPLPARLAREIDRTSALGAEILQSR